MAKQSPPTAFTVAVAPLQGSKQVGPSSTLPLQLSRTRRSCRLTCCFLLARLVHVLISIYLIVWALIVLFLPAVESHELRVQNPRLSGIALTILAALHMYGACTCATSSSPKVPKNAVAPSLVTSPRHSVFDVLTEFLDAHQDILIVLFNLCEVASQSVRVVELADNYVDASSLVGYASCVIAYAAISPWILFVRNTTRKDLLVNSLDCLFSFALSCGLFLHPTFFQMLPYALSSNKVVAQDQIWTTRYMNLVRTLVISSSVDYICQVCMHIGTFIALRRVVHSLRRLQRPTRVTASTMNRTLSFVLSHKSIRRTLVVNCIINLTWACILTVLLVRAVGFREPCPTYCPLVVRPIFDLRCNCAYVRINCHTLNTNVPEPLLRPSVVGTRTLILQLARCDLPLGLNTSTMAPHTNLYKITIFVSNLTQWDAILPPSVHTIAIRYAPLATLPTVVTTAVPEFFYFLQIDSCPLGTIPSTAFDRMPYIEGLYLTNTSLSTFPDAIARLPMLYDLNLRDNNLTTVPMTWQVLTTTNKVFRSARFNGNQLQDGTWAMVRQGVLVDLSSNPISSVVNSGNLDIPTAIVKGQVVLDDTPYCRESPAIRCRPTLCAPGCYTYLRGDYVCHPVCFNRACGYDNGDCDDMGFDRS
ncbi:Aste57867_14432 [Aphanomyces stellatus]|uniref:Aste57867_14432 protein n=1 Tax=Aphanomyces stellatus TaxID=120398 RepID=A0A485L1R0_9STRA|nr:hypothetical protein As57867_014378 [Aphanomyces stellatus]VFT91254.1 Aste57867_14432 [Aphanomyces stellatus]